ncbi:hypothetical protein OIV83_002261 [Microbotryomycetes sp. JL201]|nr:hypothetical protein OIV83_002261 [Microbotryomycetes sp. JL201]
MSTKLSPTLKALVNAPRARGGPIPAPSQVHTTNKLFDRVKESALERGLGKHAWLTLSAATLVTLNSPETLCRLYTYAQGSTVEEQVNTAMPFCHAFATFGFVSNLKLMREAGLKSISFSGIPRTINSLNALIAHVPSDVRTRLPTRPTRSLNLTPQTLQHTLDNSSSLWRSIYQPLDEKLLDKLSLAHPDLPIIILEANYGALLSNPRLSDLTRELSQQNQVLQSRMTGRVLTSMIAISCLRAQGGVGPQVLSHVFGLKKASLANDEVHAGNDSRSSTTETTTAFEQDRDDEQVSKQEKAFLTSDEGCEWVLNSVDEIVRVIAGEQTSYAGPAVRDFKAKL